MDADALIGHSLKTADQRREFLLWLHEIEPEQWGPVVDFMWEQMRPGRRLLVGELGKRLQIYSSGRSVLVRFIALFHEALNTFEAELPSRAHFEFSDQWHKACSEHFGNIDSHIEKVVDRFQRILAVMDEWSISENSSVF